MVSRNLWIGLILGVTYVGARDQIAKQLASRGDIPPEHMFKVSSYIAKTVSNPCELR